MNRTANCRIASGPRSYWPLPLHFVAKLRRDPFFAQQAMREYGPVVRFRAGIWTAYLVTLPEHVKHILQDRVENYPRSRFYQAFEPFIGKGLLSNEGPAWKRQRQMIQPAFCRERLTGYVRGMAEATSAMLDRWQVYAQTGQPFDLADEIKRLSLRIIGQTLCGFDFEKDAGGLACATACCLDYATHRMNHMFTGSIPIPTRRNRRFWQARRLLNRAVFDIIAQRRSGGDQQNDLLAQLLQATADGSSSAAPDRMNAQQLRDEVMTFILTGHETVAAAVTWTAYLLAQHPECDDRLQAEVADVLSGDAPSFADTARLQYTEMVLSESMRLYPPVWRISRKVESDDELGGYRLSAGSLVMLCPYVTHRLSELWENPDAFDPQRFAPSQTANRHRYAFFPFAGGPHRCIGAEFAMLEASLIVAMIAQRYQVRLAPGRRVEPDWGITLRPRGGVWVTIADRSAAGRVCRSQLAASQIE